MRILYGQTEYATGKHRVFYVVPEKDWFLFSHSTNVPLLELIIDEVSPENNTLCQDLYQKVNETDEAGEGKYFINGSGALCENEGWVRYFDPAILN